jgi:hypothetical protein
LPERVDGSPIGPVAGDDEGPRIVAVSYQLLPDVARHPADLAGGPLPGSLELQLAARANPHPQHGADADVIGHVSPSV